MTIFKYYQGSYAGLPLWGNFLIFRSCQLDQEYKNKGLFTHLNVLELLLLQISAYQNFNVL
jgi:hypothetical protein